MPSPKTIIKRKKQLKTWAKFVGVQIPKGFDLTGVMGKRARQLLASYQRSVGLKATGKWSTATVMALEASSTPTGKLLIAAKIWHTKRSGSHYSYPNHNLSRMTCPPLPGVATWTDCSGMIRCMWQQLGWADPTGMDYAVWGNSDAIIQRTRNYGEFVPRGKERAGDIACYTGGVGHAELVVGKGRVLTNGNESGPYYRALGAHSGKLYICRLAPFV